MKAIIWTGLLGFIGLMIWGIGASPDFIQGFAYISGDPWGIMAAGDMLLGLILFSLIVFLNEKSKSRAALWILSFFMIGNPATAIYLLIHFNQIKDKLS